MQIHGSVAKAVHAYMDFPFRSTVLTEDLL